MTIRRRVEIQLQTMELIVRQVELGSGSWCPHCASYVETVDLGDLCARFGTQERPLQESLQAAGLHVFNTAKGRVLVCLAFIFCP
jgi:hypothetical protein